MPTNPMALDRATIKYRALAAVHYALHMLPVAVVWGNADLHANSAGSDRHLLVAMSLAPQWAIYLLWFASAALGTTVMRWLWEDGGVPRRVSALGLSVLASFASVLLVISLIVQGTFFNAQFFFHAEWPTIVLASKALAPFFFGLWAYWLVVNGWLCLLPRGQRGRRKAAAAAGLAALAATFNLPFLCFVWYAAAETAAKRQALLVPKPPLADGQPAATTARDLVFIFAEGLEDTLGEPGIVGSNMTPRLTALARQGLRFTSLQQVAHTGWTTGAFVAAQCAVPLGPSAHATSLLSPFDFDVGLPGAQCLGDRLSAHGYRTVFMGGAPLAFGGKGTFLAQHGFAERHGLHTLRPLLADPDYVSDWGIFDDSLFALALDKLAALQGADAPFALTLLTLDTHAPRGHPSASCGTPAPDAGKAFAVRCADRLIADFIATVRVRHPAALVVLFSDHLVTFDNALWRRLAPYRTQRRLRFVAWGPDVAPGVVDRPGTHFDVAPTVLELLGIPGWERHNLGASLLRHHSPWFAHPNADQLRFVFELPNLRFSSGADVTFDPAGPTIEVGGLRLLATGAGLTFDDAVFALAWSALPDAVDVRHFEDDGAFEAFAAWAAGRSVLGVSTQPAFNQKLVGAAGVPLARESPPATFFAGRAGAPRPAPLVEIAGWLYARQTVALP